MARNEKFAHMTDVEVADLLTVAQTMKRSLPDDPQVAFAIQALATELRERGKQACGKCVYSGPSAVDWGCYCDLTADELHAQALEFARIHD